MLVFHHQHQCRLHSEDWKASFSIVLYHCTFRASDTSFILSSTRKKTIIKTTTISNNCTILLSCSLFSSFSSLFTWLVLQTRSRRPIPYTDYNIALFKIFVATHIHGFDAVRSAAYPLCWNFVRFAKRNSQRTILIIIMLYLMHLRRKTVQAFRLALMISSS